MKTPFKLKYKNSAFPFKTDGDDSITELEKSLSTEKQKKTILPIVNASGTVTREGSHGGGFAGFYKPTKFGGITLGVSGGGSTSKKHDYPTEGYKFTPRIGVRYNIPVNIFGKKKKGNDI